MCNPGVTQLAQMKVLWICPSWNPACTSPPRPSVLLLPVHTHTSVQMLLQVHPSACGLGCECTFLSPTLHIRMQTHILKCTHPVPFSYIHLRTYTDLSESSCFLQGFIYRSCLVVNVKGRKPLRGCLSCVNQPRLRALGSLRGGFLS